MTGSARSRTGSRWLATLALALICLASRDAAFAAPLPAAHFQPLGSLPGSQLGSVAGDLSSDGLVAVGGCDPTATCAEAWRWTAQTGLQGLGFLPGETASTAQGVSSDGAVVVGVSGADAFRWSGGPLEVVASAVAGESTDLAVSADGGTIVGNHYDLALLEGASWRSRSGVGIDLSVPFAIPDIVAFAAVSSDGELIAGYSGVADDPDGFVRTGSTVSFLPGLPPASTCECGTQPNGISADGSVVVGFSGGEAFRWTQAEGTVGLGFFFDDVAKDGDTQLSFALDVSDDGTVVVGRGTNLLTGVGKAFVWTAASGIRDLRQVLAELGVDVAGWTLTQAIAVSADGKTILGDGVGPSGNAEAWVAVVPLIPDARLPALGAWAQATLAALVLVAGWIAARLAHSRRRAGQNRGA